MGKLLRIDVGARRPVARIVALGLRNPWRFSVDRLTGAFYIGDVGQRRREEIDVFRPGVAGLENYGWRRYEGTLVNDPRTRLRHGRLIRPVHEYLTRAGGACAVTGGFVYRGSRIRSARGRYFFGDYCSGRVSSFALRGGGRPGLSAQRALTVPGRL